MAQLKVFRTAIGFHDVYVAAPSRKAALAAWGVGKDLFARGAAEVVTDPALTAEPLANPGIVIRKSRGSLSQQLHALGPTRRSTRAAPVDAAKPEPEPTKPAPARRRKAPPRPTRAAVDKLEAQIAEETARAARESTALREREQALARERAKLEAAQRKRAAALADKLSAARERHRAALARWVERYAG